MVPPDMLKDKSIGTGVPVPALQCLSAFAGKVVGDVVQAFTPAIACKDFRFLPKRQNENIGSMIGNNR